MNKHIPTITSFFQRPDVLEFTPVPAHQKGKPRAQAPSLPFGMVRNARVNHLFCYKSVNTCSPPDINVPHSWKAGLVSLFPSSECIPTAPLGSTLQFSVSASLISHFNCFVTPFSNLPTSTLSNIPQPSFVANGFAPTQERTVLCWRTVSEDWRQLTRTLHGRNVRAIKYKLGKDLQTIYLGTSAILTTQISEKTHRLITAFPHASEVWIALFLPEVRLCKKMPAQPSAVSASAAPDRSHGTKGNTSSCKKRKSRAKRNPEHTSTITKIPRYSSGTHPARGKCRLSVNTKLVVFHSVLSLQFFIRSNLECDLMVNRLELGMRELG